MDNLIVVVTHKNVYAPDYMPYKTIAVGRKKEEIQSDWKDDQGENIADKNDRFCELTALYWIWKNKCNDYDNIGLCHYRRYFSYSKLQRTKILDNKQIDHYMSQADVILPTPWYWNESVISKYYNHGYGKRRDTIILQEVISELYPEYLDAFHSITTGKSASYCNMFVLNNQFFNSYCIWLFNILFEVEKRIDISEYNTEERRVFGYLSEILLNVWVKKNDLRIKYLPLLETEKSKTNIIADDIKNKLRMVRNRIKLSIDCIHKKTQI